MSAARRVKIPPMDHAPGPKARSALPKPLSARIFLCKCDATPDTRAAGTIGSAAARSQLRGKGPMEQEEETLLPLHRGQVYAAGKRAQRLRLVVSRFAPYREAGRKRDQRSRSSMLSQISSH